MFTTVDDGLLCSLYRNEVVNYHIKRQMLKLYNMELKLCKILSPLLFRFSFHKALSRCQRQDLSLSSWRQRNRYSGGAESPTIAGFPGSLHLDLFKEVRCASLQFLLHHIGPAEGRREQHCTISPGQPGGHHRTGVRNPLTHPLKNNNNKLIHCIPYQLFDLDKSLNLSG